MTSCGPFMSSPPGHLPEEFGRRPAPAGAGSKVGKAVVEGFHVTCRRRLEGPDVGEETAAKRQAPELGEDGPLPACGAAGGPRVTGLGARVLTPPCRVRMGERLGTRCHGRSARGGRVGSSTDGHGTGSHRTSTRAGAAVSRARPDETRATSAWSVAVWSWEVTRGSSATIVGFDDSPLRVRATPRSRPAETACSDNAPAQVCSSSTAPAGLHVHLLPCRTSSPVGRFSRRFQNSTGGKSDAHVPGASLTRRSRLCSRRSPLRATTYHGVTVRQKRSDGSFYVVRPSSGSEAFAQGRQSELGGAAGGTPARVPRPRHRATIPGPPQATLRPPPSGGSEHVSVRCGPSTHRDYRQRLITYVLPHMYFPTSAAGRRTA
jgi:hypothetical protein